MNFDYLILSAIWRESDESMIGEALRLFQPSSSMYPNKEVTATYWPVATRLRTSPSSLSILKTGIPLASCIIKSRIALGHFKNLLWERK